MPGIARKTGQIVTGSAVDVGGTLRQLLRSKKFITTAGGILAAVSAGLTGTQEWGLVIQETLGLVLAYVGFQGLADLGKEKAKQDSSTYIDEINRLKEKISTFEKSTN